MSVTIVTNNRPRELVDAYELTPAERADFDYLDWPAIDEGRDSATFFRYRGELYDLGEFSVDYGITRGAGLPGDLAAWQAYRADSFWSAMVVRIVDEGTCEGPRIVVGRVYS